MTMMKKDDLKKMDVVALKNEEALLRREFFNLRLGLMTGQVKDTSQFSKIHRQIARILTLIKHKSEVGA